MKQSIALCATVLAIVSAGCFHQSSKTPIDQLPLSTKVDLQVLTFDGTSYDLRGAFVHLIEIRGTGTKYNVDGREESFSGAIALADVSMVKTRHKDVVGSLVAYGTIGILIGGVVSAVSESDTAAAYASLRLPGGGEGSCPQVFAWDGKDYRFESETFAGAFSPALEFTQIERLDHLTPDGGEYRLALANYSPESQHSNFMQILAVDHPQGTTVRLDGQGAPHTIKSPQAPLRAVAYDSTDVSEAVRSSGNLFWESDLSKVHPERDGIVCEFSVPTGAASAKLLITASNTGMGEYAVQKLLSLRGPGRMAWNHDLESDPAEADKLRDWLKREGGLDVFISMGDAWVYQGRLSDVGTRVRPERVVSLDLRGLSKGPLRVRLEETAGLWNIDVVAIDYSDDESVRTIPASLTEAVTGDGRNVTLQLEGEDSMYFATLPGDYALLRFAEVPRQPNFERTYLLVSRGYYHPWVEEAAVDYKPIIDRILGQPQLGQQLYLAEWKEQKHRYAQPRSEPRFSP